MSLAEAFEAAQARVSDDLHTVKVGRILSYDAVKMTASISIDVKRPFRNGDGTIVYEDWPSLSEVPVIFPRCKAYAITWPLVPGDTVLLLCLEDAIGEWRQGTSGAEPADTRRHSLGYVVAIPGLLPDADVAPSATKNALVLGATAGLSQIEIDPSGIRLGASALKAIALADPLVTLIGALNTFASALGTATPTSAAPATALGTAIASLGALVPSTLVKAY